jgi:hypothetical protein
MAQEQARADAAAVTTRKRQIDEHDGAGGSSLILFCNTSVLTTTRADLSIR